jgi:hypothetical protein
MEWVDEGYVGLDRSDARAVEIRQGRYPGLKGW